MRETNFESSLSERFSQLEKRRVRYGVKSVAWALFWGLGCFFRSYPPSTTGPQFLNLACGDRRIKRWCNADFYRLHNLFWDRAKLPDWFVDLTKPLMCKDNYWDGILIEHANEHLLYTENVRLFSEVFCTLKPGGLLRLIVPDLDRYINWASLRLIEPKMARYESLPEAISNLTQNHGHMSVWNKGLIEEVLTKIGFVNIENKSYRVGNVPEMLVDAEGHKWESLYVEAFKPKY